ncbi:helix-turn-helix domain-containing protein [Fodinicurvata sediminis]|uniref:helix-turn-helix domain-containing protein n=1 Tax=Fodinicurvata sediminis TaxID=1121832 RepID=UPI0003B6458D|nr:transcriptional regulator [Fodinicurvata sediminis]
MTDKTDIGSGIIEGLEEAIAWKRGDLALETVNIDPMPATRIRAIRRKLASSTKVFEKRFGIPASTMNNWEQGRRKPDPAARLLFQIIEREPETVERIAHNTNHQSAA